MTIDQCAVKDLSHFLWWRASHIIPRPRQTQFVERSHTALNAHKNTLGIAVTGFGKTAVLGFTAARYRGSHLVIQHRDELVEQNAATYNQINTRRKLSYVDGRRKQRGNTTFAMVQSLAANPDLIPSDCSLIMLDEAHHYTQKAEQWLDVVNIAKEKSPKAHVFGVTATPRPGMDVLFSNVSDHVTIKEMMAVGLLSPLRSYACTTPQTQNKLDALGRVSSTGDQEEVAHVLDNPQIMDEVFGEWSERAGDRPTVVFCASVDHARHVCAHFTERGISAGVVHGGLSKGERREILERFDSGDIQVVCNVFVLTEGWDCPAVSCAILLRQCSDLGPLIQMVGRILRIHPGKKDAILLDFGTSILTHGTLEQDAELLPDIPGEPGVGQQKFCPEQLGDTYAYRFPDSNGKTGCGAELPANSRVCPFCQFEFERVGHTSDPVPVELTEIDLLNASPFRYVDLFSDGLSLMACGFDAWAMVVSMGNDAWCAVGGRDKKCAKLHHGSKLQAIAAADDFLRVYETEKAAKKSAYWMQEGATKKQVDILARWGYRLSMGPLGCLELTKYEAACHTTFRFNKNGIIRSVRE